MALCIPTGESKYNLGCPVYELCAEVSTYIYIAETSCALHLQPSQSWVRSRKFAMALRIFLA